MILFLIVCSWLESKEDCQARCASDLLKENLPQARGGMEHSNTLRSRKYGTFLLPNSMAPTAVTNEPVVRL